jgi:membrane protease YdiL (CAAX protease family)
MGDIFYGLLLWIGVSTAASVVLVLLGVIGEDDLDGGEVSLSLGALAVSLAAGWVGTVGWPIVASYRKGQRSLARDFGLEVRGVDVGWGALCGLAAMAVAVIGNLIWLAVSDDDPPSNAGFLPDDPVLWEVLGIWLLVGVCTPIAEELFFRGLALRAIGRRWGLAIALPVSSLLFGALHVSSFDVQGLFFMVVTAGYGAVFGAFVILKGGRLGPAIVGHALVNTVATIPLLLDAI